ncbi:CopD family protein [Pseudokineococcus sp. 5B2Z-1]|uniref:CopD family protein n=1 Tax=Pseudokineococcus sp. 5B2Z-1 TaxID=3132744 RepID=UPI0030A5D86A
MLDTTARTAGAPRRTARRPDERGTAVAPDVVEGRVAGRRTALVVGGVLAALAVAAGVAVAAALGGSAAPRALADPGAAVRWGAPLARAASDVAALGAVGSLVLAVLLLPSRTGVPGGATPEDRRRVVVGASRWALAWCAASLASAALLLADVAGLPLHEALAPDVLPLALDLQQCRALLASAWLAALVAVAARRGASTAAQALALVLAVAALVPPVVAGHAGHGEGRALALTALLLHVGAAAAWVGGLAALLLHLRRRTGALAAALPRYSALALVCCAAVTASGVLAATTRLPSWGDLQGSGYGLVVMAKALALALLVGLGAAHRRRSLPALAAGRPRALLRLAAVELIVVAVTAGLAAGLARTEPPPAPATHAAAASAASGLT